MRREKCKTRKMKKFSLVGVLFASLMVVALSYRCFADENKDTATVEEVKQRESKTLDLLSRIDAFKEENPNVKLDAAKAHYNMGNIYFEKGEYEIAAREYYQAVTLMPDDPDAHFNLAFVSGEYLNDQETALKHYQMYIYLKPDAEDKNLINEKILQSRLFLDAKVDSKLDTLDKQN